jgi:hypothetical protein
MLKQPVKMIPFTNDMFDILPNSLEIYKMIAIGPRGVRIFLWSEGTLSLYWDEIVLDKGEAHMENLNIRDFFDEVNHEVPSELVMPTDNGYVQIIYYPRSNNLYDVNIRVFNYFNRRNTKNYREYKIDELTD